MHRDIRGEVLAIVLEWFNNGGAPLHPESVVGACGETMRDLCAMAENDENGDAPDSIDCHNLMKHALIDIVADLPMDCKAKRIASVTLKAVDLLRG